MDIITEILVFTTNIKTQADQVCVKPLLDQIKGINRWTIDCDDVDCVLRVEAIDAELSTVIIAAVQLAGFQCAEME